jgi:hypothetical protein
MNPTGTNAIAALALGLAVIMPVAGCSGPSGSAGAAASGPSPTATESATGSATDPAASGSTAGDARATRACTLVTEQEARVAIGVNPGAGQSFSSHGSTQCQFGTYQSGMVLVNLSPTRGIAGYDLVHNNPKLGQAVHVTDIAGVGDRAFEITAPHTASIYFDKGDALVLVMVETPKPSPATAQVLSLAKSAAGRL